MTSEAPKTTGTEPQTTEPQTTEPQTTHQEPYIRARLQLATCLRALRRVDKARHSYQILLSLPEATREQKQEARQGLEALSR